MLRLSGHHHSNIICPCPRSNVEDFCIGPLIFDVACCASACCFRTDGALDIRRLRALLGGYAAVRPLTCIERASFLAFMRLTMFVCGTRSYDAPVCLCVLVPLACFAAAKTQSFAHRHRDCRLCNCTWRFINFNIDKVISATFAALAVPEHRLKRSVSSEMKKNACIHSTFKNIRTRIFILFSGKLHNEHHQHVQ